ncbi:MAG: polysaccharide deacetylase family protein [Hyphomicrobiaceae bacterium]|nr:polysaccharide deacetylase family protein [Hyphomicrobiaceae bacterium]
MPWKERYTVSDEVSLGDHELQWPSGTRMATCITVALSPASGPEGITAADMEASLGRFGMYEGLDLVLDLLARYRLRATFAVPALMAEIMPERVVAIAAAGHEIAALGLRHEDTSRMQRDEEAERIGLATEILARTTGKRPQGWYCLSRQKDRYAGGAMSPNTVDLLREAGYVWLGNGMADDIPYYTVTDFASRRCLLTLPYYYHLDDQYFSLFPVAGTGLENADMLARNWRGELDAQYERGRYFSMVLHPQHAGFGHRLELTDQFLAYLASRPGVWTATGSEIAGHWLKRFPADSHLRLEPEIWKSYEGSLS